MDFSAIVKDKNWQIPNLFAGLSNQDGLAKSNICYIEHEGIVTE